MKTDNFIVGKVETAGIAAFDMPKRTAYVYFDSASNVKLGTGVCEIPAGSSNQRHKHDGHNEVIFVLKGELRFVFPKDSIILKPHEAIYIPDGLEHQIFNDGAEAAWHTFTFDSPVPADNIGKMYRKDD